MSRLLCFKIAKELDGTNHESLTRAEKGILELLAENGFLEVEDMGDSQ